MLVNKFGDSLSLPGLGVPVLVLVTLPAPLMPFVASAMECNTIGGNGKGTCNPLTVRRVPFGGGAFATT